MPRSPSASGTIAPAAAWASLLSADLALFQINELAQHRFFLLPDLLPVGGTSHRYVACLASYLITALVHNDLWQIGETKLRVN